MDLPILLPAPVARSLALPICWLPTKAFDEREAGGGRGSGGESFLQQTPDCARTVQDTCGSQASGRGKEGQTYELGLRKRAGGRDL